MKRNILFMRYFLILLIIFCNYKITFAQEISQIGTNGVSRFEYGLLNDIRNSHSAIKDTIYNSDFIAKTGAALSGTPLKRLKESALVIGFMTNPSLSVFEIKDHQTEVCFKILFKKLGSSSLDSVRSKLDVNYNSISGSNYKAKDYFVLDSVIWAEITIDTFISSIPLSDPDSVSVVLLESQILGIEQSKIPASGTILLSHPISAQFLGRYIEMSWNPILWAESYDLEWKFVDGYSTKEIDFKKNATRINLQQVNYKIPAIASKSKFVCRYRARGIHENGNIYYGPWSRASNVLMIDGDKIFEKDSKPWQYIANYAENGLRKDLLKYSDGSGRERQAITKLSTDGNHLIAAEQYYDFQGRPVVQTLPVPLKSKGSGTISTWSFPFGNSRNTGATSGAHTGAEIDRRFLPSGFDLYPAGRDLPSGRSGPDFTDLSNYYEHEPDLNFIPKLNVNESGEQYSAEDFDKDVLNSCNPEFRAKPMGTTSGAGKYYSPSNDFEGFHKEDIPIADGYPFSQVEYTPDNTGRVKSSTLMGRDFQIGSGKENKYYYTTPSQEELFRMFGSEVGEARKYTKVILKDTNGQLFVSYQNAKGQNIATALTGDCPTNLTAIPDSDIDINQETRFDVMEQSNVIDIHEGVSMASQSIFVDRDNSTLTIQYNLDPASLRTIICRQNLCYDCPKNLVLKLVSSCGDVFLNKSIPIGPRKDTDTSRCNMGEGINLNIPITNLKIGEYYLTKSLELDQEESEKYILDFVKKDTACYVPNIPAPFPCITAPSCIPCVFEIASGYYLRSVGNNPLCSKNCPETELLFDANNFNQLMNDYLPPNGQFAWTDPRNIDSFKISIFNLRSLGINYTMIPNFYYRNMDGTVSWIDITGLRESFDFAEGRSAETYKIEGGRRYTIPQNITNIEFLKSIWKESWSEIFVRFHPEYPFLKWNNEHITSLEYDRKMNAEHNFDEAVRKGFMKTDVLIDLEYINRDPFFNTASDLIKTDFLNKLSRHTAIGSGDYMNIFEIVVHSMFCNSRIYRDGINNDPLELRTCINDNKTRLLSLNDEAKTFAWNAYKGIYQSEKQKYIDSIRFVDVKSAYASSPHILYPALCMGRDHGAICHHCPSEAGSIAEPGLTIINLLRRMKAKFLHASCITTSRLPMFDTLGIRFLNVQEAAAYARWKVIANCNISSSAYDLQSMLNALVVDLGKPGNNLSLPRIDLNGIPPSVIPDSIVKTFRNMLSPHYYWKSTIRGNELEAEILDQLNAVQTRMLFRKTDLASWSDIIYFTCMRQSSRPGERKFYLNAFVKDTHKIEIELSIETESLWNQLKYNLNEITELLKKLPKKLRLYPPQNSENSCCIDLLFPEVPFKDKCKEESRADYNASIYAAKLFRAKLIYDSLRALYNKSCILSGNERCVILQNQKMYQFTLFYYDQAGNLTRTVPPKAVHVMTDVSRVRIGSDSGIFPVHHNNLSTSYQYNSLNAKLSKTTPDGGTTKWCYDEVGRIILSQDAVQRSSNEASYISYDARSRIKESGAIQSFDRIHESIDNGIMKYLRYYSVLEARSTFKKEYTVTKYDLAETSREVLNQFTSGQNNLRNRVSSVKYYNSGTDLMHAVYFNYDISGNTKEIVQDFSGMRTLTGMSEEIARLHRYKKIKYRYDVLTGKVHETAYQPGKLDQFYRWYYYDADNRLTKVKTGFSPYEPELYKDVDASYEYYLHGPALNAKLGMENIQELDLTYTINGWLKKLNHPDLEVSEDGNYLKDVLAYQLHYYNNDFRGTGDLIESILPTGVQNNYTGNITGIAMKNIGLDQLTHIHSYHYDQLNRLTASNMGIGNRYSMNISYDKNGNIKTLNRFDGKGNEFDHLTYNYNDDTNNQLQYITDPRGQLLSGENKDLQTQPSENYRYDVKGRLLHDISEGGMNLSWLSNDKLKEVTNAEGSSQLYYDTWGRRIMKNHVSASGQRNMEYTIRDIAGNILAEYAIKENQIQLNNFPIYAGSRIGVIQLDTLLASFNSKKWNQYRGHKLYELKNQIGDINVLVSDRKYSDGVEFKTDIRKATDYYPFGMIMPGRDSSTTNYRYGFQGMEQDNNFKGEANSYTTEFRQYDPRVGRWLSVDPMEEKYPSWSNYVAFDDNPIGLVDPKGAQSSPPSPVGNDQSQSAQESDRDDPRGISRAEDHNDGAIGFFVWAAGAVGNAVTSAIDGVLITSSVETHSMITGDYTTNTRDNIREVSGLNAIALGVVSIFSTGSSITMTHDEEQELVRMVRSGLIPEIVRANLRRMFPNANQRQIDAATDMITVFAPPSGIDDIASDGATHITTQARPTILREQARARGRARVDARRSAEASQTPSTPSPPPSQAPSRPPAQTQPSIPGVTPGEARRRTDQAAAARRVPQSERARRSGVGRRPSRR
ncbi:MAG: hypothetical protein IPM92_08945 [Saprospiraceae bacterium]|nr:hypothetical protein [Saprospiraceae bacterium]